MAKRGYKLQEFVAHSGSVNCLKIGKKNFRQFVTGGDDQVVNLWSIGKPEPVTSLSGHTSPVESVAFDSAEALVVAGSSSGAIKLWDLEETKMVRNLSGHRSYCTAVEFHPFGEFFASGSMDTNLKIWDIRKKGCIHTYKGHTRGISTIRFTPDGRWVVSGGFDNVVKIWDLTAGKLLHDFKLHEGHIRSLDFHPLEFLLATGSADRTVKFWDLETFELIGSARRENTGVRSITYHPDGRTLFCGLDDSLKVYSWEPVICHDSVDMGWSTLGDLCVHDGKLLGGAYYQNSVGVWVADIAFIEPYGTVVLPEQHGHPEQKHELQENVSEKSDSNRKSNSSTHSMSDVDSNDIKNIYVDSCNPITSTNVVSLNSPKTVALAEKKERTNLSSQKRRSAVGILAKTNVSASAKSFTVPTIVPRDIPEATDLASSRRESFASARASTGMVKPSHVRRPSITKSGVDKLTSPEPLSLGDMKSTVDSKKDQNLTSRLIGNDIAEESSEEKDLSIKNVREKSEKASSLTRPSSQENGEKAQDFNQGMVPVKVVNGVAVVRGRTRSLVERFENKEVFYSNEAQTPDSAPHPTTEAPKTSPLVLDKAPLLTTEAAETSPPVPDKAHLTTEAVETSPPVPDKAHLTTEAAKTSLPVPDKASHPVTEAAKTSLKTSSWVPDKAPYPITEVANTSHLVLDKAPYPTTEAPKAFSSNDNQLSAGRQEPALDDNHIIEALMQNHDVLLSAFRSRLTKLQMVRHFWEKKDVKGAITVMKKLPDHSVQADVISVLTEKMEIINLDLFSCLLPVLLGLLDSKTERHVSISLEMLLKLIAVFGPLVRSTVKARRAIGVDLHAEERLASCKQCFVHLQNVQKILPTLIQRGGAVARCALELNLILQEP